MSAVRILRLVVRNYFYVYEKNRRLAKRGSVVSIPTRESRTVTFTRLAASELAATECGLSGPAPSTTTTATTTEFHVIGHSDSSAA